MTTPRRALVLLLLVLPILVLSGCGSDDDGQPDSERSAVPFKDDASDDPGEDRSDDSAEAEPDTANATRMKANLKQVVTAIESCAAGNTEGTYAGCLDIAKLQEFEPSLREIEGVEIAAVNGNLGYSVNLEDGGTTFTQVQGGDGSLVKSCEPTTAPGCSSGRW